MRKTLIVMIVLLVTGASFVAWMLTLQSAVHDDYRRISEEVHELLLRDLEWRLMLESEVDEHHRALCTYQSHTGHLGCAD